MSRWVILALFLSLGEAVSGQMRVTRLYRTPPRSTVLGIYNYGAHHFYITRYNRLAHDITVERRKKSDGSVVAFTALRLDSVNAPWFNYEDLDQVFFEKGGQLFFVFSRVLNNKSELYMKRLDTLGKSSGFFQVFSMSAEKNEDFLELKFNLTEDNNLLVTRTRAMRTNVYRQVDLFDPLARTIVHSATLPPENPLTGYSNNYLFDGNGDIYYLLLHPNFEWTITESNPTGLSFTSLLAGRGSADSLDIAYLDRTKSKFTKTAVVLNGPIALHATVPALSERYYELQVMYSGKDTTGKEEIRFSGQTFGKGLSDVGITDQPLTKDLEERLTFFDGSEDQAPARKIYSFESSMKAGNCRYYFAERVDQNYFKELLVWTTDTSGQLTAQNLVPRKILFYPDRSRFKSLGKVMHATDGAAVYTLLLENRSNEVVPAREFRFHEFRRQETASGANLVAYVMRDGICTKKVVYKSRDYSCVPMNYHGAAPDFILYLVKNDAERFAVVDLNDL